MASASPDASLTHPAQRQHSPQRKQRNSADEVIESQVVFPGIEEEDTKYEVNDFHRMQIKFAIQQAAQCTAECPVVTGTGTDIIDPAAAGGDPA